IGLNPNDVEWIVIGHGHWDHAGQISEFPNAILYVQKEELKQIDFFLNYPDTFDGGHISRVNTDPGGCARSPVCGYPPQTVNEILGKVLGGKAHIVDGRHEIRRGVIIHPAFRGHTYGSQLLQVNTPRVQLVFGSHTYSSWEGIRDCNVANIQQPDTMQQMLADDTEARAEAACPTRCETALRDRGGRTMAGSADVVVVGVGVVGTSISFALASAWARLVTLLKKRAPASRTSFRSIAFISLHNG